MLILGQNKSYFTRDAVNFGIEKERMVRIDGSVTKTNSHPPTDYSLLWNCIQTMVSQLHFLSDTLAPHFLAIMIIRAQQRKGRD